VMKLNQCPISWYQVISVNDLLVQGYWTLIKKLDEAKSRFSG